jgi:sarcosine oxidase
VGSYDPTARNSLSPRYNTGTMPHSSYDVAIIGGGVFGVWTAWHLLQRKQKVIILDAYGPAHSRASSGGETRIIRMSYGADEIYTRWSNRSLAQWKELSARTGQPFFQKTAVLWLAGADDARLRESQSILQHHAIQHEILEAPELSRRYPQVNFSGVSRGLLEPESGILLARRSVQALLAAALASGAEFRIAQVTTPRGEGDLANIRTATGEEITAGQYVFACGSWLAKLFPDLLGERIFPTRQDVFFFGCPPGDTRFAPPSLPTWLFSEDEVYGMPDIESRGLKLAHDAHGPRVDPDTQSRVISQEKAAWAREYVSQRFPALKHAPIVETRVCQYENTSNGDFLIDRHPDFSNVWLAGGGSGHGFKHGPAFGEYLAAQLCGEGNQELRFSLASKSTTQHRAVY